MKRNSGINDKALLALLLTPLLLMAVCVIAFFTTVPFSIGFLITRAIIPFASAFAVMMLMLIKYKRSVRITSSLLAGTVLLVIVVFFSFVGHYEVLKTYEGDKAIERYGKEERNPLMPASEELGDADKVEYYYYYSSTGMISYESKLIICGYDEAQYEARVSSLENRYVFQNGSCADAKIGECRFRLLKIDGEYGKSIEYPKRLVIIGEDDEKNEIVYIDFYNDDLDYIDDFEEFIKNELGWELICEKRKG